MLQHMARQLQNLPGKVWQILLGITPVPLCTCDLGQRWGEGWHGLGRPRGFTTARLDV